MARLAVVKPVGAFLDLIAQREGTCTSPATHDAGYDIIVSGIDGLNSFADYSAHPFAAGRPAIVVRTAPTLLESTASGRYQITLAHVEGNHRRPRTSKNSAPRRRTPPRSNCSSDAARSTSSTPATSPLPSRPLARRGQLPRQQLRPGRTHHRVAARQVHAATRRAVRED